MDLEVPDQCLSAMDLGIPDQCRMAVDLDESGEGFVGGPPKLVENACKFYHYVGQRQTLYYDLDEELPRDLKDFYVSTVAVGDPELISRPSTKSVNWGPEAEGANVESSGCANALKMGRHLMKLGLGPSDKWMDAIKTFREYDLGFVDNELLSGIGMPVNRNLFEPLTKLGVIAFCVVALKLAFGRRGWS